MRLSGVERGAIIRVDDGLKPWFGLARAAAHKQTIQVDAISGPQGVRTIKARDVTGIWRPSKATDPFVGHKT